MRNTILRKLNRIVISGKCKNSLVRFQSFLALFSFVFSVCSASLFLIPSSLNAQDPIYPIGLTGGGGASGNPTLQLDNYDAAGMQDFFQDVNAQAGDVDSWVALVVDNIGMVRASWESEADLQIQDYVNNLNVSDNYNGVANYRDALEKELNSQKEAALALWERTANTDIYLQLEKYVTSLTGGLEDEAVVNTENSQSNATEVLSNNRLTPEQIKASFAESKEVWENQFQTSADTGLKQYDDSLDAINANYARFMRQLDNADGTFQQNLQAIQEYKNNVKSGIRTTVTNLENFLNEPANDSLFGGSNGKSRTQAGLDLNSLIIEFRALLAPNAQDDFSFILTELASKMRDYLGKQAGNAATRQTTIQNQVYTNYVNNDPSAIANMKDRTGAKELTGPIFSDLNGAQVMNQNYQTFIDYFKGKFTLDVFMRTINDYYCEECNLTAYQIGGAPPTSGRAITKIYDANIFASSHPWFWEDAVNNATHTAWGASSNYQSDGAGYLYWQETLNACQVCAPVSHFQDSFAYKISYQVTDFTAQTNAVTWGNFANQLNSQFSNWQNNLIPTISNWESQAANYNNFYHQWKSNADTLRANAKTEYEASTAKIESDRSKWLLAMENQKKDADKEWDSIESKLTTGDMTKGDLSALLSQTPSADAIAVTDSNAQVNSFNTTLNNLQNTKFNFQSTDYRDEIARYNYAGEKPKDGLSELKKFGIAETIKSALTDPFSNQNSYSIFNPEYNAPSTSVTGINLKTAFTSAFNGVQNLAYVNGTTDAADRYQKEYYDSIVNQYKYTFNEEVMYDLKMKAAIKEWNADPANVNNQIALQANYDLKAARKSEEELVKRTGVSVKGHEFSNEQLVAWENKHKAEGDIAALSEADKKKYKDGDCYKNLASCGFMEVNKDLKSITVENGQIVITREISDGTIHLGDGGVPKEGEPNYNLVGGYQSGKKTDVIRVNMAKMGVVIQNPKDLFTQWTNEDYNAIADNLSDKATELYASAEKDSKLITTGISDSVKRGEQLMQVAMGAAQSAVAKDEMVKSVVQAYLTGGMAGIQSMVKDKIRDAFIDKVAEATGINPDLVRFATGRFEQAKLTKKMNNQASKIGTGVGVMASLALGPVGPLMMAGPMGGALLGAGAGGKLGSSLSGGTLRTTLNNPIVDAGLTMSSGLAGAMMGGPAGLVAGVAAKNKLMQSSSVVGNNNQYNALQQQENALIQDAAGAAVANAIGRPDAAGNFSQILGGLKKRQVAKKNNANLGKVASSGVASALNMANGMVKGIVKNAVIAVGGRGDTFDYLTANPFTPPATWTGAAKVDMSKEGWKDRIQEYATAEFLEANGMDADLAKTVASTTNAKIKAKKAKKEEKTKAIESTAQTALAVAGMVLTAGAATPLLTALGTSAQTATLALDGANIALQATIGSRTGGQQGALAGAANGLLQAYAGNLARGQAGATEELADNLARGVREGTITAEQASNSLKIATDAAKTANLAARTLAATNVSYTKEDGWGIKANMGAAFTAIGIQTNNPALKALTNVTIGQSQRGGATLSLGMNIGAGNLGLNYTGATGKWDGSMDIKSGNAMGLNLGSQITYDGNHFGVNATATNRYGLGMMVDAGIHGVSASLMMHGSQAGTVDQSGHYEANTDFLSGMNGQDIMDEYNNRAQEDANATLEGVGVQQTHEPEEPTGLLDLLMNYGSQAVSAIGDSFSPGGVFATIGAITSAAAAWLAGRGVTGNGGNANNSAESEIVLRNEEEERKAKDKKTREAVERILSGDTSEVAGITETPEGRVVLLKDGTHFTEQEFFNIKANVIKDADIARQGHHIDIEGNVWVRDLDFETNSRRASEAEANMIREGANVRTADMQDEAGNNLREVQETKPDTNERDQRLLKNLNIAENEAEKAKLIKEHFGQQGLNDYNSGKQTAWAQGILVGILDALSGGGISDRIPSKEEVERNQLKALQRLAEHLEGKSDAYQIGFLESKDVAELVGNLITISPAALAILGKTKVIKLLTLKMQLHLPAEPPKIIKPNHTINPSVVEGIPHKPFFGGDNNHPFNKFKELIFKDNSKIPVINGNRPRGFENAGKIFSFENANIKDPVTKAKLQSQYPKGIKYTENGFPDFKPHATKRVEIEMTGNDRIDFARANKAAKLDVTPEHYTWHHNEDLKTMELVPTLLHNNTPHTGGASIMRQLNDFLKNIKNPEIIKNGVYGNTP